MLTERGAALAYRFEAHRLLMIVPDSQSDLVRKGEVTERYYHPGELFREMHIVMTNDNRPDSAVAARPNQMGRGTRYPQVEALLRGRCVAGRVLALGVGGANLRDRLPN